MLQAAKKLQLGLPVPISFADVGAAQKVSFIRATDWMKYLASHNMLYALSGLDAPNAQREEEVLQSFWSELKFLFPRHPIYNRSDINLGRAYPYLIHGDEVVLRKSLH